MCDNDPAMARLSRRIPRDLGPNRLSEVRARTPRIAFDLTVTNPTLCGFPYPPDLLSALAHPRALRYEPDPRGLATARAAIAASYGEHGITVDPSQLLLTASTSEAYSMLVKLLCDAGDVVLVPAPSYPLFAHLAGLDGVRAVPYRLDEEAGWRIEAGAFDDAPARTRAVIVVHPNNPTGSFVHPGDRELVVGQCRNRGWALIADEVFLPFVLAPTPGSGLCFASTNDCLCFTLGGLSKSIGLPQLKLAWTVVSGPAHQVAQSLAGLEYVADTYLSVSSPVAAAVPDLLERGRSIHDAILERCRGNLGSLQRALAPHPAIAALPVGGGWSAALRIPNVIDEEDLVCDLLATKGIAVMPGFFFDFERDGYLVVSLLPRPDDLAAGIACLIDAVEQVL
jgi:alanine-synthesizing transaminase